jgi:two-component system, chemotaxis family, protein-glutamate methylesterase/glutaminase
MAVRILIVDDSFYIRTKLRALIATEKDFRIVGSASDYHDALRKVKQLKPDVIILNIFLPESSGLDVIHTIMNTQPTPILAIGEQSKMGSRDLLLALRYGAVDYVMYSRDRKKMDSIRELLINRIKTAVQAEIKAIVFRWPRAQISAPKRSDKIILIGASTGGPPIIEQILKSMPKQLPVPIIVLQHMPKFITARFAERLDAICKIDVKEAEDREIVRPGTVYLAPGNTDLELKRFGSMVKIELGIKTQKAKAGLRIHPSINVAFKSAVKLFGKNTVVAVLTGMGEDGLEGAREINQAGGKVIAQNQTTSVVYGMSKEIVEHGYANKVLPHYRIAKELVKSI